MYDEFGIGSAMDFNRLTGDFLAGDRKRGFGLKIRAESSYLFS